MSRFFRDQLQNELYIRRLRRAGIDVVSVTQSFADDPSGNLIRQILGSFDEYQSAENGKHTLRAMRENARQDFWNGSVAPFGYVAVEAERRGAKVKKRLAIDEAEAAVVRRIYDLAVGKGGLPLGVKAIASQLNAEGVTLRGKPFRTSSVHRILTSSTYHGVLVFNRRSAKTRAVKPRDEWVTSAVPAIVSQELFSKVQASLASRSPAKTPPRLVTSPVLLGGIARCATCGSGMTLRTGKSGRYRYYTCAGFARMGRTACPGRSIAMAALDGMVIEHLCDALLTPERLVTILQAYLNRSARANAVNRDRLAQARRRLTEAEGRVSRLLELVETGMMPIDDPTLKDRLATARTVRQEAADNVRLCASMAADATATITSEKIARFGALMRDRLRTGDMRFRKAYLRLFLGEVVVGDTEIRLRGPKAALAQAAIENPTADPAAVVPGFVREWRARWELEPTTPRLKVWGHVIMTTSATSRWPTLAR